MIHYYTQKRELPPSEIYEDMKTSAVFEILSLLPPEKYGTFSEKHRNYPLTSNLPKA